MNHCLRFLFLFLIVAVPLTATTSAANGQEKEAPQRTVLEVSAAKVPDPPLKYRLLPGYGERKPGNAAVYYGKVTAERMGVYGNREFMTGIRTLLELPIRDRLQSPDLEKYSQTSGYYLLRAGALCDDCDWQIPMRDQNAVTVPLSEVQQTRMFQRCMGIQAIAQIREKNIDGAMETIQTGFALARHVGKAPLLVNGLVALASVGEMRGPLELLIEQPETPSLYWALAWLPEPFVDLRLALEAESDVLLRNLPGFDQLDSPATDPKFWSEQYLRASEAIREATASRGQTSSIDLTNTMKSLAWYPVAKGILAESGLSETEIEQLPVGKVCLLAERIDFVRNAQSLASTSAIPWWQLSEEQKAGNRPDSASLTSQLWFASGQVRRAHVRMERTFNALQTIEGIRHFAATHDGRLPETLDEMTETPAPLDPVSGNPFEYRREGNTFFIDGPVLEPHVPFGYEVHLRK